MIPAIAVTGHVDRLWNALLLGLLIIGLHLQADGVGLDGEEQVFATVHNTGKNLNGNIHRFQVHTIGPYRLCGGVMLVPAVQGQVDGLGQNVGGCGLVDLVHDYIVESLAGVCAVLLQKGMVIGIGKLA